MVNKKQVLKVQHGGVVQLIATIGTTVIYTAASLLMALSGPMRDTFALYPEDPQSWYDSKVWYVGYFWRFIFFCIKSSLYLVIFAFGGPIVTLFGIVYLYMRIYDKNIRPKTEDEKKAEKLEGEGGGGGGEGESGGNS